MSSLADSKFPGILILVGVFFFLGAIVYYVSQVLPGTSEIASLQSTVEITAVIGLALIAVGIISWQLNRSGTETVTQ